MFLLSPKASARGGEGRAAERAALSPRACAQSLQSCGFALRAIIFHPAGLVNNSLCGHRLLSREQRQIVEFVS